MSRTKQNIFFATSGTKLGPLEAEAKLRPFGRIAHVVRGGVRVVVVVVGGGVVVVVVVVVVVGTSKLRARRSRGRSDG